MPAQPTKPDLVQLTRRAIEAANRRDLDTAMSFYVDDAVWDWSSAGGSVFEGTGAVRCEMEAWITAFGGYVLDIDEIADMGGGVTLAVTHPSGGPAAAGARTGVQIVSVNEWNAGKLVRVTYFRDLEQARAAAERLAEEQG